MTVREFFQRGAETAETERERRFCRDMVEYLSRPGGEAPMPRPTLSALRDRAVRALRRWERTEDPGRAEEEMVTLRRVVKEMEGL